MKKVKNLDELETLVGKDAIEKCFMEYMLTVIGQAKRLEDLQNHCAVMDEDEMDHHVLKNEYGGGSLLDVGCYGLHFASWYLGDDITHISAEADYYKGTDRHACVLLKYRSGAIADLSSATLLRKPNEGYVYGTKGYAYLKRFYAPQEIVLEREGKREVIPTPYTGNGFEEQIEHFCGCLQRGLTESPLIPHAQTLKIITLFFSMTNRKIDFSSLLGLLPILMKTVTPLEWSCRLK